jgi:hypothetical protein
LNDRPAGFELLRASPADLVVILPLLAITGPAIMLRNTIRGRRLERRKVVFVAAATAIAAFWSLILGRQVLALTGLPGA